MIGHWKWGKYKNKIQKEQRVTILCLYQIEPDVLGRIGDISDTNGYVSKTDLLQVAMIGTISSHFPKQSSNPLLFKFNPLSYFFSLLTMQILLKKATRNSSLWRDCLDARSTAKVSSTCFKLTPTSFPWK